MLPTGSSALERAASAALADALALPVPLRELWSPRLCPARLLPYLAWALSVDRWDQAWPEKTKRAVIESAFFVHQHKGTIGALRRVVEPLGYLIEVIEWWQSQPEGQRGTFRLKVGVLETGITDEMYQELERVIDDAKPLSRHLIGLAISLESRGNVYAAAAAYSGDEMTVYPYTATEIIVTGRACAGGGSHIIDTMSIYP